MEMCIRDRDNAVKLYSAGSTESALVAEWDEIEPAFRKALKALRVSAETPEEIPGMSRKEKIVFIKMFQNFDKLFAQLKSFTQYDDSMLEEYGITQDEYEDYVAHYLNVKEEVQPKPDDPQDGDEEPTINMDYELMAYSHTKMCIRDRYRTTVQIYGIKVFMKLQQKEREIMDF